MWTICMNEFKQLLKSTKSIFMIVMIFILSSIVSSLPLVGTYQDHWQQAKDPYSIGNELVISLFGFFLIFLLSHDILSREIHLKTIRFLVSKTTRLNIVIGKYLGLMLFWISCIMITYVLNMVISHRFLFSDALEILTFISVGISFTLFLSILFPNPQQSMFVGMLFSLLFPIVSVISVISSEWFIHWFQFITPYFYARWSEPSTFMLMNVGMTAMLLIGTALLFQRRDV
ncbi:ABC transporter permease subunit [Bacillus sp. 179-C3.3 HS]|uniref:ABC transporter permease subunit n=1 Tax=Bacillus sp. 179-C3.3 HS TaxID=3232162 RepID=UPI0039A2E2BF